MGTLADVFSAPVALAIGSTCCMVVVVAVGGLLAREGPRTPAAEAAPVRV
jgi:hypothetical protein